MFELIISGVVALAAMCLGAYIYSRALKEGADIVWRTTGDRPPLFDNNGSDYLSEATTEEMDSDLSLDEHNEPPLGE